MNISDSGTSNEVELNLSSFIDCFTVLITYLLVSASFLTVGMLDVSVATNGPAMPASQIPTVSLELALSASGDIQLKLKGTASEIISVPNDTGSIDAKALSSSLNEIKGRFPTIESVLVSGQDQVGYQSLVKTIEKTEAIFKSVALKAEPL